MGELTLNQDDTFPFTIKSYVGLKKKKKLCISNKPMSYITRDNIDPCVPIFDVWTIYHHSIFMIS